jgi:hypothetical protein
MRKKLTTPTVVPPLGLKYRRLEVEGMGDAPELPRADQFWRNRERQQAKPAPSPSSKRGSRS